MADPMHPSYGPPGPGGPVPGKVKSPLNIWWPMSFLIVWLVLMAVAGGLLGGAYTTSELECVGGYTTECAYIPNNGYLIGGIICFALGGVFHIVFWVLLAIYLVKRSRARRAPYYYGHPGMASMPGPGYGYYTWHPGSAAPPQQQQQQPPPPGPDGTHLHTVAPISDPASRGDASTGH